MQNANQSLSDRAKYSNASFLYLDSFNKLDNAHTIGAGKSLAILIGITLPLILFSILVAQIADGRSLAEEQRLLFFIHNFASPIFDKLATLISVAIGTICVAALAFFIWRRVWRTALFWLLAVGGASILSTLLKHVFKRERPHLWAYISSHATYSFPSGHATLAMAFAMALLIISYKTRHYLAVAAVSISLIILVGLSRLYLGVHYPTDILASWLLASAWVTSIALIFHNCHGKYRIWTPR